MLGRRSKLNHETIRRICGAVALGLTYDQASEIGLVGRTTFYRWKAAGKKATSGPFKEFWDALQRANVSARLVRLKNIMAAANGEGVVEERHILERVRIDPDTGKEKVLSREVRTVIRPAMPDWHADKWLAEKLWPSEYGKHLRFQPDDSEKSPLRAWLESLKKRGCDNPAECVKQNIKPERITI